MNITDQLALQRLGRRWGIRVWTDQPDQPRTVPNRAERRRNRGAAV
ncbi:MULTISPECIES: hypothetical protein [unclassified Micromonospora]